jgi:hypothetical protein
MMATALLRQVNAGSQAHVAHAGAPRRATQWTEATAGYYHGLCWGLGGVSRATGYQDQQA